SVSEPRRPLLTEKLQEYDLVGKRGIKTRITSLQERNLSLDPYVVSLNVTLKHWMTICGECQKNNVLFEGYIHIYLCIDILCQWKIPNWQHV
ncbi:hypothetical protein, partial [Bacteroides uniformis]|uniref:hypothetical protein n=1 Tax=Bacteroides uniformis TaxID=820 RepID=UPI003A521DB3